MEKLFKKHIRINWYSNLKYYRSDGRKITWYCDHWNNVTKNSEKVNVPSTPQTILADNWSKKRRLRKKLIGLKGGKGEYSTDFSTQ